MPNTERARAWLAMLHTSDNIVFQLFTMAAAGVILWEFLRRVPEPGRRYIQLAFLSGSLGLFVYVISGGVIVAGGSALVFVVGALGGAAAAAWVGGSAMAWGWDWRRPLRRRWDDGKPRQ